ncbi:MAG TPA: hypothetical protein VFZ64_10650 [Nocardioidaceae bacterium]
MTDMLQNLLREEAARVDVPPPPVEAILAGGRRRRRANRTRGAFAIAASVVVVAGGLVGVTQLADDGQRLAPAPAGTPTAVPTSEPQLPDGPLEVSGSGVGDQTFGTDAEDVLAAVTARFGEPDLSVGPQQYFRVPGQDAWFADAEDPLSPSWQYPVTSVSCWRTLCLIFGGDEADTLELRGWELAEQRRWSDFEEIEDPELPDVRLAGSGVGLGDSWERLHTAYPRTVAAGAEGASLVVRNTPWDGISDGAGPWRLSGQWDYTRPTEAPDDAVVTRLSGGDGPEPGCC